MSGETYKNTLIRAFTTFKTVNSKVPLKISINRLKKKTIGKSLIFTGL